MQDVRQSSKINYDNGWNDWLNVGIRMQQQSNESLEQLTRFEAILKLLNLPFIK